jgi:hypothetical protein
MRRHLIWAVALGLAMAGLAGAQETTSGSLAGQVVDAQGAAIPGATVTITSDQGSKSFTSDANGRYFAPYLTPGRYSVRVELAGFSPVERKDVQVRLGQRLELPFTMKVGERQEVIEVVGGEPVIDTSSTTTGGVLEADALRRLPVGRNFTDTLYLVPGVSDSSGVGKANPSVSGASGLDNNYIVDGVNITNTGFGGVGTYSIVFGSLGTGVTQDFIKETQVKTGGFEAEYGQATGGVVNVVTQSGTNAFHGGIFGYFKPSSLESSYNQLESPNGTVNVTGQDNYDFGATLGGPLMKDKLFFFGAFNPQYQSRTMRAPSNFPLASLGEVDRKRHTYSYAGKLTYQLNPSNKFEFSAFGDPSKGDMGPQRTSSLLGTDTSSYSELTKYGGHNQSIRYDGIITTSWLIEASVAHSTNTLSELPAVDSWRVTDRTVTPNIINGGIGVYDQGSNGKNTQYSFKSTNIFNAAGNHQLRYGVQFEDIGFLRVQTRTGPTFTLPNGQVTRTGASVSITADPVFGQIYRVTRANYGPSPDTTQKYLNFFAQDTWQVGRLTLRPGVRWERQHLIGGGTPACHVDDTGPGFADGTGAPKNCEVTWTNLWSPRVGATYDVMGNGKAKIYASFGRFLSKVPNDLAARALSPDSGVQRADYFDANLTQPIPDGVVAGGVTEHLQTAGSAPSKIAPDARPTYSNEIVGGLELEVARSMNLGVRWVHRTIPRVMEDYQPAGIAAFDLGCPGADSVEYLIDDIGPGLARFNCDSLGTAGQIVSQAAFEDPKHDYDSFELTATKNFSNNWSLMASYRYARLKGNFEGFYRSDNGQSDPSITSLFDFPTNDPSYTQVGGPLFGYQGDIRYQGTTLGSGALPNDRPHQVKVYGTYVFGSLNAGIGFNAGSGAPLTALAANPNYSNSGEIPLTLRGGGLDTASVSGCSACGGLRKSAPALVTVDLHLDYTVRVGKNQRVILSGDAFNLLNNQDPASFDNYTETSFGDANPNFGLPILAGFGGNPASYNFPRSIRLGARFEF